MMTTVAIPVRDLMTTKDVESEYGIPEGTLRYYRSTGKGPASFRLAGRIRYRRSDILSWIADQEKASRRGGVDDLRSVGGAR
jgi:DNA-binding transcriptional MerR regulator